MFAFFSCEAISIGFKHGICKKLRESLNFSPGQKVQMVAFDDRIEMIPIGKISEMEGFLKGIDTTVERETDRI